MRAEHAALSLIQFLRGQRHPIHVVCNWLGNSPRVVAEHYLRVTESDFQSALGQKTKFGAAKRMKCPKPIQMRSRPRSHITKKPRYFTGFARISLGFIVQKWTIQDSNCSDVTDGGVSDFDELDQTSDESAARGAAILAEFGVVDPRLLGLIDAWPTLSEDARDASTRLAGLRPDGLADVTTTPEGDTMSR